MVTPPAPAPRPSLLGAGDPSPVRIRAPDGCGAVVLIGDHAGRRIPAALGDLGLAEEDRDRHIGWDIGVADLGAALSDALDAPFVEQVYSRLVIDCNRDPAAPGAMPDTSDGTLIPANTALSPAARAARIEAIHSPYHEAIAETLAARPGVPLVSLHSFTPALRDGPPRPWAIGILHDGAADGFARRLLAWLRARDGLVVGDNEPYAMAGIDYTVPRHAFADGRPYAEIEIRQDVLAGAAGRWSALLSEGLAAAR